MKPVSTFLVAAIATSFAPPVFSQSATSTPAATSASPRPVIMIECEAFSPLASDTRTTFEYNAFGVWNSSYEVHNGVAFNEQSRDTSFYNTSGQLIEKRTWLFDAGEWKPGARELFTYNSNGLQVTNSLEQWNTNTQDWLKRWQNTVTYDSNNFLIQTERFDWSGSAYDEPVERTDYTNNAEGKPVTEEEHFYDGSNYVHYGRITNAYNPAGYLIEAVQENHSNGTYTNSTRTTYSYESDFSIHDRSLETWENDWQLASTCTYTYEPTGTAEVRNAQTELTISPNPVSSFMNLHFSHPLNTVVEAFIFSMDGRMIHQQVSNNDQLGGKQLALSTELLPNGMYILRLVDRNSGEQLAAEKFIKQ